MRYSACLLIVFWIAGCGKGANLGLPLNSQTPSIYGTYTIYGIQCGGVPAGGLMANWTTSGTVFTGVISTTQLAETWTSSSCSITATYSFNLPGTGQMSLTGTGTYVCSGICAAYSTSLFGSNICGGVNNAPLTVYQFSPSSGAASGGGVSFSGGISCSGYGGGTDPATYLMTKN